MWPYANSGEALTDVLRLSSGMTYKAAMAGLPQGGGKAVIIGDPRKHKSAELMQAMGRFVDTFAGRYIIAEDSGISVQDVEHMASQTNYATGKQARYSVDGSKPDGNPAPSTAYGVFCGIKAAVEYTFVNSPDGSSLLGKKVAIQGVGHVGLRLARLLHNAGAKLFVSDIFDDNLKIAADELGATIVDKAVIHSLDVDVYAPCAMGAAINKQTLPEIKARIIAGAANNQLASVEMDSAVHEAGKVYVPDYVLNAGGIIDLYHQTQDTSSDEILRKQIEKIGESVKEILDKSNKLNLATQSVSNQIAEKKFKI